MRNDFTMCDDTGCLKRVSCHRNIGNNKPDKYQSMFMTSPRKGDRCEMYWEIDIGERVRTLGKRIKKHDRKLKGIKMVRCPRCKALMLKRWRACPICLLKFIKNWGIK